MHMQNCLSTFNSILQNQAQAMKHLAFQYRHSDFSKQQLNKSLNILNTTLLRKGKIVISGIGKSHKIAAKIVATMNSLAMHSALLHPSEALHGDLGILQKENNDCLILISSSGESIELLQLLPHISPDIPIILLTNKKISTLSQHFQVNSLLFAELPAQFSEQSTYGLTAPTISTTLLLCLADAVSIALSELYIQDYNERKKMFGERHPGGAIGESFSSSNKSLATPNSFSRTSMVSEIGCLSPALNSLNTCSSNEEITDENVKLKLDKKVVFDWDFDEDSDSLEINHLLLDEINASKNVLKLSSFYILDELEFLTMITVNDFVIFNENFAVSSAQLRDIYKEIHSHQYNDPKEKLKELNWRIKKCLTKIN